MFHYISEGDNNFSTNYREPRVLWGIAGVGLLYAVFGTGNPPTITYIGLHLIQVLFLSPWIYNRMIALNRNPIPLTIVSFLFPSICLLIAGFSDRKPFHFKVNKDDSPEKQIEDLKELAISVSNRKESKGLAMIYEYMTTYLPCSEDEINYRDRMQEVYRYVPTLKIQEQEQNNKPSLKFSIQLGKKQISKIALIAVMICGFLHLMLIINKPLKEDGISFYGHIDKYEPATDFHLPFEIVIHPYYWINLFYTLYFIYLLLLVVRKIESPLTTFSQAKNERNEAGVNS